MTNLLASLRRTAEWNFDIDRYVNRYVPPSQLHRLPYPVSRFLGYRKTPEQDAGNIAGAFWAFVGTFCGLAVIAAIFNNSPSIQRDHPPALIASFGASAILEYNAIKAPLGQPRNALFGHTLSAIIGVAITKLFLLHDDFEKIKWIAGAVGCGISSGVMSLTNTVHPPGGASAVLAATLPQITDMGWNFVPLVMLGSILMVLVGLITNNIQRQFPVYWWTPHDLRSRKAIDEEKIPDGVGNVEPRRSIDEDDEEKEKENGNEDEDEENISISAAGVLLPEDLSLNADEAKLLENLRDRLLKRRGDVAPFARRASSNLGSELTMVSTDDQKSTSDGIIR